MCWIVERDIEHKISNIESVSAGLNLSIPLLHGRQFLTLPVGPILGRSAVCTELEYAYWSKSSCSRCTTYEMSKFQVSESNKD